MKLSIVMPVYNEIQFIREIIKRVQEAPLPNNLERELIIVEDCSKDGTREILQSEYANVPNISLHLHEKNMGKGAALRTGFNNAHGDIILIQDADLEYDPKDYPRLLEPILDGRADVVYGSRFLGGPHRVLLFWHYLGNRFLTFFSNFCNNINLTDMETCYKVFRKEAAKSFQIKCNRFGVEPEITAKIAKRKFRIYETPISYSGRSYDEGKKITWKDGITAMYWILRFRFFE